MLPTGGFIDGQKVEEVQQPSYTWHIDFEKSRVIGKFDGLEAVKQYVHKALLTDRYDYLIYTPNYGSELKVLLGIDRMIFETEVKRIITETISYDDRIVEIRDWDIKYNGDSATVRFTVICIFGNFEVTTEVF